MDRRHFLSTSALSLGAGAVMMPSARAATKPMGLTIASYRLRWGQRKEDKIQPPWRDALDVLTHCQDLGAGCLQIGVAGWTQDFAGRIRDRRESLGIALEGQIALPWKDGDLGKFEAGLRAAKEAGAMILRTTCLGSRRYETFDSLARWQQFVLESRAALERAEPLAARHGLKLAVENHKDWRVPEHLELLRYLDSEWIGVTFDFGNNLALLEDPLEAVAALAPYIMTTHLKDMALAPHQDGFLLSEVPLGQGILDLEEMMDLCIAVNPGVWFNLEMITRDPLLVPVKDGGYWATFGNPDARDLERTLQIASAGNPDTLPKTTGKTEAEKFTLEEKNVKASFSFAKEKLGLS